MVLLASDITSTRLAVKFAIYKTPRGSSSARSEAWPPIDTTVPKVALQPTVARDAAKVIFHQQDLLNITVNSKRQISNFPSLIPTEARGRVLRASISLAMPIRRSSYGAKRSAQETGLRAPRKR